ncbi:MAG TPA: hypothetical protein PLK58_10325 [Candidatus Rifleibacterium sp.]|nr:hypothetical protein [Candidatus Rifleibacterium sp.]
MVKVEIALNISEKIKEGLKTGEYIRIGGVIRQAKNKRIVALLKEADLEKLQQSSGNPFLQLSIADISMVSIQHQIKTLSEKITDVYNKLSEVEIVAKLINKKMDSEKFAKVEGLIERAIIALKNKDREELKRIRCETLELQRYFEKFLTSLSDKELRDVLKTIPDTIQGHNYYFIALSKFRIALETILGDNEQAKQNIHRIEETVTKLEENLKRVMNQPQTLFFISDKHRNIVRNVGNDMEIVKELAPQFQMLEEENLLPLIESYSLES